jgi:hypothetical protein
VDASICLYHGYTGKTLTEFYGGGDEYFKKFIKLNIESLEKHIKKIVDRYHIQLIHSQNAPDFLTVAAIRSVANVPIIHDNQDCISLRKTPYSPDSNVENQLIEEKMANQCCSARIHVSDELRVYIQMKYGSKRDIVFSNYVSESMVPPLLKDRLSEKDGQVHIVYEGTLASLEGDHYDLREIFKDIALQKMPIHIYDSHANEDYRQLDATSKFIHYHAHLAPRRLLEEMTQYDFGWAGFNVTMNKAHLDVALPNKMYEYIASGLPVLSFPHKAQKTFLEKHGVGLVFKDFQDMQVKFTDKSLLKKVKKTVLKKRFQFTVERNIQKILDLYESI